MDFMRRIRNATTLLTLTHSLVVAEMAQQIEITVEKEHRVDQIIGVGPEDLYCLRHNDNAILRRSVRSLLGRAGDGYVLYGSRSQLGVCYGNTDGSCTKLRVKALNVADNPTVYRELALHCIAAGYEVMQPIFKDGPQIEVWLVIEEERKLLAHWLTYFDGEGTNRGTRKISNHRDASLSLRQVKNLNFVVEGCVGVYGIKHSLETNQCT